MRKNTTTSSFRKVLPRALLIALVLFAAFEAVLYVNRPNLISDFWNKFLVNEHNLLELDEDFDYLLMGDSVQKTGIDPTEISPELLNLGLPGAKPMGQYLLLRRYLESHEPPRTIFLYVDPENPFNASHVILRYFVSISEALLLWNDLDWEERYVFVTRYLPSLDLRQLEMLDRDEYKGTNRQFVKEMISNRGFMPSPRGDISIGADYFVEHTQRVAENVNVSERDMEYLDKFMALAEENGIEVVFIHYLVPSELYFILERTGFNRNYLSFIDLLKRRYPGAYFLKKPILVMNNAYFGDMAHVNEKGVELYTRTFKTDVFDKYQQKQKLEQAGAI